MGGMRARRTAAVVLLLAALPGGRGLAAGVTDETLVYRWRLEGLLGVVAGLFMPSDGEGRLTLAGLPGGNLRSELLITAGEEADGDFFRYGSEWEPETGTTVRAWSSQRWRGEPKSKQAEIGQTGVIDVATAVHALRRDPPEGPRSLEIWSDGKLYPVVVLPRGIEQRRVDGRLVEARHFAVRPVERPDRRVWKGEMDLWLATDEAATPIEIRVARSSASVRLELVERLPSAAPAGETRKGDEP